MIDRKSYMLAYNKAYYQLNKDREKKRTRDYVISNPEKVHLANQERYKRIGKEYRLKNIDRIRASARKYWMTHPRPKIDKIKARQYTAKYRKTHKEIISKRNVLYAKNKKKTDVEYKIKCLLRNRILSALKKNCAMKAYKSMELLGCSIEEYKRHLERQFTNEMNWGNHGIEWEIDHIIPVATFNLLLPEEQKKAFHFSNTQPLNLTENRKKQPKRLNRIVI